jgi:O-antigen/teichoic acid export membrane protein
MIQQLRSLIVSANQVLVPAFATMQERMSERVGSLYLTSYQVVLYLALPLYSLALVCAPLISRAWIGHYEGVFVFSAILLGIGWFLNTLTAPAYFANLGIGDLRWNLAGHIATGLLNIILGCLLGLLYGGTGVIIALVVSLVLGSGLICLSYHIAHKIPLIALLPREGVKNVMACSIGWISVPILHGTLRIGSRPFVSHCVIILPFLTIVCLSLWFHPMRKRIFANVANELGELRKERSSAPL